MFKLLSCAHGHYWETPIVEGADGSAENCPVCGQPAETMPLLDLAPAEAESTREPPVPPAPTPLCDKDGRPLVAGYEILEDLGKGLTGLHLYKARQVLVNRTVVLKVVLAREDPGQFAWGSLRGEASALGRLVHPNIVRILEAGERERQLFYNAVEYVEGPTLAEALDGKPLPLRQAVVLVETLARAIHHAHQKNILHRSLKPASILPTMPNAECRMPNEKTTDSAFCIPKITDFGLARRPVEGDASDADLQGELPCYLAPEQAWGRAKEIGPATDIYALGAILYELISGRPPFREATAAETLDAIQCREPPPLSRLRSRVSGDLDAICRKCLAKQPRRRYASALDLAEDLRRCAEGHPIKARVTGNAERLGKWLRRHARGVAFVLLGCAIGALFAGLFKAGRDAPSPPSREQGYRQTISRLESDLRETRQQKIDAEYLRYLLLAGRALDEHANQRGLEMLERCPTQPRHWEWDYLHSRLQEKTEIDTFTIGLPIACVDVSRDGLYLVVGATGKPAKEDGAETGEVSVWELSPRKRIWRWQLAGPVRRVAFSPDDSCVALLHNGDRFVPGTTLEARHVQTGVPVLAPRLFRDCTSAALAYSADSRNLLTVANDGTLRMLQANNAARVQTVEIVFHALGNPGSDAQLLPIPTPSRSDRLALISPDASQILVLSDLRGREKLLDFRNHEGKTYSALAYDGNAEKLAVGGTAESILLWDARFPYQGPRRLRGLTAAITGLSFSSDGKRLASCGTDGIVRIWDPEQGLELLTLKGYEGASGVFFCSPQARGGGIGRQRDRLLIAHGDKITILRLR